jgi:hypothetical protein
MKFEEFEVAPMMSNGKCSYCDDYARDCDCHLCPSCENGIKGNEAECNHCGYEVDAS